MKKKVSILNHEQGNTLHIIRACEKIGFTINIVNSKNDFNQSDKLIIPGVGRFKTAIENLRKKKLIDPLKVFYNKGNLILGICLGFQLLFEKSKEDVGIKGLELIKGEFLKFSKNKIFKVPQIQWNKIKNFNNSKILKNIPSDEYFYFNHSFYLNKDSVNKKIIKATSNYNKINYPCVVESQNLFATQFHPEKSGIMGLEILNNFKNY